MLIDRFIPSYDYREFHSIRVHCSREEAFRAIRELTPAEFPSFVWLLFWLRGLPARLTGRTYPRVKPNSPILEQLASTGFVAMDEAGDREIVIGLIGQYWKPTGGIHMISSAEEFLTFDRLDLALAAMNFTVVDGSAFGKCLITTETRIYVADPAARRWFRLYWTMVRPGSALIRRFWLQALKQRLQGEKTRESVRKA
jgi:hypothetical protein